MAYVACEVVSGTARVADDDELVAVAWATPPEFDHYVPHGFAPSVQDYLADRGLTQPEPLVQQSRHQMEHSAAEFASTQSRADPSLSLSCSSHAIRWNTQLPNLPLLTSRPRLRRGSGRAPALRGSYVAPPRTPATGRAEPGSSSQHTVAIRRIRIRGTSSRGDA